MFIVLLVASPAHAIQDFMTQIPNAAENGCDTCHTAGGGTPLNAFGDDFDATRTWADVAPLDSDGDGCANGVELGDPEGTWMDGDTPGAYTSHPGVDDCADGDPLPPVDTGDEDDEEPEKGCSTVVWSGSMSGLFLLAGLATRRRR